MRFGWFPTVVAAAALILSFNQAKADLIADLNGSPTSGVMPAADVWQQYQYQFVAQASEIDLTFLMRNDPSYMGLDTIAVSAADDPTNTDILQNGSLDQGPDATSGLAPAGWATVGQPGLPAAGYWTTGNPGASYVTPQSGAGFWYDGAVGGYDGISQALATIAGDTYNLSFWLESDPVPNGSTVDYQVFAGALPDTVSVTSGTISDVTDAPEPMSLALIGTALAGLGVIRRLRAWIGERPYQSLPSGR